jgi:hypothetical protein
MTSNGIFNLQVYRQKNVKKKSGGYSEKTTDFSDWSIYLTALHIIGWIK